MHMYSLGYALMERGHKVCVLTGCYKGERTGIRYLNGGMKVYYMPLLVHATQSSIVTFLFGSKLVREIILRESIDVVHCHQGGSSMMI